MIVFIDDILNGNISELLPNLYETVVAHVVIWWSVLPMVGIIFAFVGVIVSVFGFRRK